MTVDILLINSLCSGLLKCVILFCHHQSGFLVCILCCVFYRFCLKSFLLSSFRVKSLRGQSKSMFDIFLNSSNENITFSEFIIDNDGNIGKLLIIRILDF